MKRIQNGITYNTQTAARVALLLGPEESGASAELYQTRHGAFFEVVTEHDGETQRLEPLDDAQALDWMEKYANDQIEAVFGSFPEAGAAERRLTVRVPGNLAERIEAAAQAKALSVNSYAMRCLEKCVAEDGQANTRGRFD